MVGKEFLRISLLRVFKSWTVLVTILVVGVASNSEVQVTTGGTTSEVTVTTNTKDVCASGDSWCSSLDGNEILALEAIRCLHRQLDDDADGIINLDESDEFLREELKYEKGYEKRHKAFHVNNDNQVSVRELWETWVKSEVHNWTSEQTLEWLEVFVGLPHYQTVFTDHGINGTFLPRLAVNHLQFLSATLGIKDVINRQKISLKAQDVVLFGPPKEHANHLKDMVLTTLLAAAIILCWFVYSRYKIAQRELKKIVKDMDLLAKAEKELMDLQKEIEKTKEHKSKEAVESVNHVMAQSGDFPPSEEISRLRTEVDVLRGELQRAEVELQDKCWVPPPALQHWLQLTYELELKNYNKKKVSAERQLKLARDACDKLKKKRSSLMGAFVSTHGRSIDDVDQAILEARTSLTEITQELQERMHRWKQIEMLLNSSIMNNPGIQYLENTLRSYGRSSTYGAPSVISNSQDDIDDDAASSIYCPSAVHKLVCTSAFMMFPGQQNLPQFSSASNSSTRPCPYQQMQCDLSGSTPATCLSGISNSGTNSSSRPSAILSEQSVSEKSSPSQLSTNCHGQIFQCPTSSVADKTPSIDSNNSVSAPATTNSQLSIIRSKSVASMMSYREKAIRDMASRESSQAEDEIASEASEMVTGNGQRDRRVTFGIRNDHRTKSVNFANTETTPLSSILEMKTQSSNPSVATPNIKEVEDNCTDVRTKETASHPEEPDLIKVPLSLTSVTKSGAEDVSQEILSEVKTLKGKRGFWKSISKLVARNSEDILHHNRRYKVHGTDEPPLTLEVAKKSDSENGNPNPVVSQENKLRFLSSFRHSEERKHRNQPGQQ